MTNIYNQNVVNEPNPLKGETSGMFRSLQTLTDKIESLKVAMGNACNTPRNMDTKDLEELSAEFNRLWSLRDVISEQIGRDEYGTNPWEDYVARRKILPIDLTQMDIWRPQSLSRPD